MHARHHRRFRRPTRPSPRHAALAACVLDALEQRRLLAAPVALPDGYTTDEDTPLVVAAPGVLSNDLDEDLDPLTAVLNTGPTNGEVVLNADGSFTYTPDDDFNGSDSFTYDASDGTGTTTATATINVISVNDAPTADAGGPYTVAEDGSILLSSSGSADADGTIASVEWDLDNDAVFGETGVDAVRGAENVASPEFLAGGVEGPDSFTVTVRVTDNDGAQATDTATVNVTAVNDNPLADNDDATVDEDGSVLIDVLADDTDLPETGETLTITGVTDPEHGTAVIESGQVRYTPDVNYNGGDSFTYTISDGNGGASTANVTVTITPVNDAPVVPNVALVRVKEGQSRTITLPAEDTETDATALVFRILSLPGLGVLKYNGVAATVNQEITGSPLNLTYTLDRSATVVSATAFTYEVTDAGDGGDDALTSDVKTVGLDLIDVGEPEFSFDAGSGAAFVYGTEGGDDIVLTVAGGNLRVTVDGVVLSNTTPITSIRSVRVFGLGGNDLIDGAAADRSLFLQGGWGNDTLTGGARRDVLDGRQGNDALAGGNHNDLLAGGDGEDDLTGGAGRDVLIGGAPPAASTYASLRAVAEQWAETLRPVSPFSTGQGITDEEQDELTAGTGADWFIRTLGDVLDRADVQGDRATTLS